MRRTSHGTLQRTDRWTPCSLPSLVAKIRPPTVVSESACMRMAEEWGRTLTQAMARGRGNMMANITVCVSCGTVMDSARGCALAPGPCGTLRMGGQTRSPSNAGPYGAQGKHATAPSTVPDGPEGNLDGACADPLRDRAGTVYVSFGPVKDRFRDRLREGRARTGNAFLGTVRHRARPPSGHVHGSCTVPDGTVQEPSRCPSGPLGTVLGTVYVFLGTARDRWKVMEERQPFNHGPERSRRKHTRPLAWARTVPKETCTVPARPQTGPCRNRACFLRDREGPC